MRRNLRRVAVHLVDKAQKHFFFFTETGGFKVRRRLYELLATVRATFPLQKDRRDRGVRLQSERAIDCEPTYRLNQLAESGR